MGLSTDEFNSVKGKTSYYDYSHRKEMLEAIRYVDLVIPESSWNQKPEDIAHYGVDLVVMGDDWAGSDRFERLREYCDVVYLERTPKVSSASTARFMCDEAK